MSHHFPLEHGHVFPALTVDTSSNIVAGRQVLEASREEQPGGEAVEGGEAREGEPALHARAVPREGAEDPRVSHCPADKIIIRQSQVETCVPIYKSCLMSSQIQDGDGAVPQPESGTPRASEQVRKGRRSSHNVIKCINQSVIFHKWSKCHIKD